MTTFVQNTLPVPAPAGNPFPGVSRLARSVADTAAILAHSFAFAKQMESAHTPAARRAVLDRFAA